MNARHAILTLAAIAAVGVAAAQPGVARSPDTSSDTVAVRVGYSDLNLESATGAKAMLGRIHVAAKQICGDEPTGGLDGRAQYRACLDQVTSRAVSKLGSPMVTAANGPTKSAEKVILSASR